MRRLVYIAIIMLLAGYAPAQDYGQGWIDFNKQYFKVSLTQEGIYRLSYADLSNSGFPVTTVDPRRIQLYYRGVEQAIYVEGQADAIFNTADYIEFYGKAHDGKRDAALYQPEAAQPHDLYSLFSDSSAYFLTYTLDATVGKRMSSYSENNVGGLPAEPAAKGDVLQINTQQYAPGQGFSSQDVTRFSYFDYGEGWTGIQILENEFIDYQLTGIVNRVTSGGDPQLEILLVGRDDLAHNVAISVGQNASSLRNVGTLLFDDYETGVFTATLNWSDISAAGELMVRIEALGISGGNDRLSTSYLRVRYPEEWDMGGASSQRFDLYPKAGGKSYVEISDTPGGARVYDITDPGNTIRVGSNPAGSGISAIIRNTAASRSIYVNSSFKTPVVKKVKFRNIDPTAHNYIILSNKYLMKPWGGESDVVRAYGNYRASNAGGSYDTLIVDVNMLYDQYNYGEVSPLAVFNFMKFMVENGSPEYFFIIGKGLDPSYNFHRRPLGYIPVTIGGTTHEMRDLVPPSGNPGSDILYTAGLGGTTYEPAVPVGRLPARQPEHVVAYLNKVKEMEAKPYSALWRKDVLHLSGGISASELVTFRNYMDGFASIAEDDYLGGEVKTIDKQTSSTVELINVADEVNKGLNLVTFFGHSAPNITDIDIGFVTDPVLGYENSGKYPMFLINGCNAGQFFKADILFGEDWMLAADKGALGFIAHSSYGFAGNLRRYTEVFYQTAYGDSLYINKSIGKIHKQVATDYMSIVSASPNNITQVQQMVLLGDPATTLFGAGLPDYETNDNAIFIDSFNGEPINAEIDSFAVNVIVRNYGRTSKDSLAVQVARRLNDNTTVTYDSIFAPVDYQDTLVLVVQRGGESGFGNNRFTVTLDYITAIDELDEANNTGVIDFFIPFFGTKNLYPLPYSIINQTNVELLAQSSNLLEGNRNFVFEIDTVKTFNSPVKMSTVVNAKLLASWHPPLLSNLSGPDSTVYFWRTRYQDPLEHESDEWVTSSFIFIQNGPEGWSQSVFAQFDENQITGLERNAPAGIFDFETTQTLIDITTYGAAHPATVQDISIRLNGAQYNIDNDKRCRYNTVNFIAFDKTTTVPYAALPLIFQDPRTCGRQPQVINSFRLAEFESGSNDLIDFVDAVKAGDSVVMFTIGNPSYSSWSPTVLSKLEELGASAIDIASLTDGEPYVLFGRKGAAAGQASQYRVATAPVDEQQLDFVEDVTGVFSSGYVTSTRIGPATTWAKLINNVSISETPQTDEYYINVTGIDMEGRETLLLTNVTATDTDLSMIDARQYPYLQLTFYIADDDNLTPARLNKWQVIYTPAAEGILLSEDLPARQVEEGEPFEMSFGFKNISNKSFSDSLLVRQTIFNTDVRQSSETELYVAAPAPGDTTHFVVPTTTVGLAGTNDYSLFVNPRVQAEQFYENNLIDVREFLTVSKDKTNPLIDVVFDGQYIMNGDIVSPNPLISITMKDENKFLTKTDTTGISVFLKNNACEGCDFERVAFSSAKIQWYPATTEEDFRVEYRPGPLADGTYALRVTATDASGNSSGEEPYLINFEVVNESTITNFYPYPNPFSSSVRFIFTVTGSIIPDQFKIQIMTVSGKVVREITQDELGAIHIGNNITDYAWDGRDEFGDQLANGVYLYKVVLQQSGDFEHRATSGDKAFSKGFGKLYLLR